jgi:hypothetical protein
LPSWKRVKVRYKPLKVGDDEYEISHVEFIRGQIALVIFRVPLSLFVAALIGTSWPNGRWPLFLVVFGLWTAMMIIGILNAIKRQ